MRTPTRLTVLAHGPLRVEGPITLTDREDRPLALSGDGGVKLCRCGQSGRKPLCDGSHARTHFRSAPAARALPRREMAAPPAPGCTIVVNPHGALRVAGEFQLVDESGTAWDLAGRTSMALCRCGATGEAPFCDGTHKTAGFDDAP